VVMAELVGTAAVGADTAVEELAQPVEVDLTSPPETAAIETPETVTPDAPETDTPPQIDLRETPEFKDALAREAERIRRKTEHEASQREADRDREWVQRGEYVNDLTETLRRAVGTDEMTGEVRINLDPKSLSTVADRMWSTNLRASVGALAGFVDEEIGDYSMPAEEQSALRDAYAEFTRDPRKATGFLKAQLSLLKKAAVAQAAPELRKEIERDVRREYDTRAEAERRSRAEASARAGASATDVSGAAPNAIDLKTVTGIMRAKAAGRITEDAARDALNALN